MTLLDDESGAERLGIVGSGTIACGLAVVAGGHGPVMLWARSDASAERAERSIATLCTKLQDERPARRVTVATDPSSGLEETTFVVEAIAEELEAKRDVLGALHERLAPGALLATTTSSLPVAELACASGRPDRFAAFHVFNPVPRMELVELAFPEQARPETRRRTHALARRLGKQAVEVPTACGFVVNRLLFPYLFDAVRFVDERGTAPADVDACMTLGAGHPMGPLALLDYIGLDVACAIGESLGLEVPERLRLLVGDGALGRKAGRGFHTYS